MKKPQTEINFNEAIEISKEVQETKRQNEAEHDRMLKEAKDEVLARVYEDNTPFSYTDIEDIMSGYGLEMDNIEDILF